MKSINEHEYIVGLLKKDGISYAHNDVHVSSNEKGGYFISIGKYGISGDTLATLNFMFDMKLSYDSDYHVSMECKRRAK